MDLTLSADQQSLQAALRDILRKVWTPDRLREASNSPALDSANWVALADMGVFGVMLPEEDGGMGLGLPDAVVLFEELGKALVPGPLVATLLAARLLPDAGLGKAVVTAVDTRDRVAVAEHFEAATHLVIVDNAGLFLLPTADCVATQVDTPLDPLTPLSSVTIPDRWGVRIGSPADAVRWRSDGTVLTGALQVGLAQGGLDLAVRYATERVQFGRVIGSFQAVKHLLAEWLVKTDVARAAVLVAALATDDSGVLDAAPAVSAAKVLADKAATEGGRCGIQVHGGMGFTWEVLAHLYLKRAWLLATSYGSGDEHALRLAAAMSAPEQ
ncbi:MAG: Acyl-CoA dehydrogenase, N-terminal domain [Nocardia sp.]|uniref:acyl-CoA dehydrogenase family protein n=1 Tax=Nocardia sp. TaxID=1821 RepID=UPI002638F595|nr:acyl-CoA dehydrogenase family protein [Nocardia sp.]MCU1644371.1 Acyl-CoA dehydrogenase, N-terminal domain [Nocardia sp.]